MSAERKKILEMVAEGKISAEDAERLLDKIGKPAVEGTAENDALPAGTAAPGWRAPPPALQREPLKNLAFMALYRLVGRLKVSACCASVS